MIDGWKLFHSSSSFQLSEVLPTTASGNGVAKRKSRSDADLALLDKLVTSLLERKATETSSPNSSQSTMQRLRPLSRSLSRSLRLGSFKRNNNAALPTIAESGGSGGRSEHTINPSVKNVLNVIRNAPHRFSTANDEENKNLTQNILQ